MKLFKKKSGHTEKTSQRILDSVNEFGEKASQHFSERFVARLKNVAEVRLWVAEWALLVLLVFLLAIVQQIWYNESFETEAYTRGGEYSEATLGRVNSMNPLYATTSSEKVLAKLLFANLVAPDVSGHLKNELAKSVTADDKGKNWTLKLREGLTWSDGEPITADDVIYTIKLINDSSAKTTVSVDFSSVGIEKVDDLTVKFALPSVYTDFVDSLEFPLVPEHILGQVSPALVYENNFSKNPIGSGPFVLNAVQSTQTSSDLQTIYLNRNEKYFKPTTKLNNFTLKTYESSEKIVEAMRNSEVMATAELSEEETQGLPGDINRRNSLINGGAFAFLNTQNDILKNVKVRQAIAMGVDMEAVRADIEAAKLLDYPILENQLELEWPELHAHDEAAARKMLQDAGYVYEGEKLFTKEGEEVPINLVVRKRSSELVKVAQKFAEQLEVLGFAVNLNIYDESQNTSDFFSTVVRQRDYDILFYEVDLGVSADPFVYYSSTQATDSGWNFSNYSNAMVDAALLTARSTTNLSLRNVKLESFLKYWVNDVPAIGLYRSSIIYSFSRNTLIYSEDAQLTDALDRFSEVQYWASARKHVNLTP